MAGRLPYKKRKFYPHMIGDDRAVWDRFVDRFPDRFDSVDYDFRVGEGAHVPKDWEDTYVRMALMLSKKRIDVVGWVGDSPTIIEVKRRVGLSALGQVLGYKTLFTKEFTSFPDPNLLVVCEMISDDDMYVLEKNGIPVEVV